MSGVEVPPLGSLKDRVLRAYLLKQAHKEVIKNKVFAHAAICLASLSGNPKGVADDIISAWGDYMNLEMYLESTNEKIVETMKEEYEYWKKVRPKLNISKGKDGGISLSMESLKPAKPTKPPKPKRQK